VPEQRRTTFVIFMVVSTFQLSAINGLIVYTEDIFTDLEPVIGISASFSLAAFSDIALIGSIVGMIFGEIFTRRKLAVIGGFIISLMSLLVGFTAPSGPKDTNKLYGFISYGSLFALLLDLLGIYGAFFAIYVAEIGNIA
jgi:hypothetical protein